MRRLALRLSQDIPDSERDVTSRSSGQFRVGCRFLGNSLHDNPNLGVELGTDGQPTPNASRDVDEGFQDFPLLARLSNPYLFGWNRSL